MKRSFLLVFIVLFVGACAKEPVKKFTRFYMGTYAEISVSSQGRDSAASDAAVEQAFEAVEFVQEQMNTFNEESLLSKLNKESSAGELNAYKLDDKTFSVLENALHIGQITGGAFDVTVAPLIALWGFYSDTLMSQFPKDEDVKLALSKVGFSQIVVNQRDKTVSTKAAGVVLDLAGIAKGFGVDEAVASLRAANVDNAIVNIGGDLYCMGNKSQGESWSVGVQHPRDKGKIIGVLKLSNVAVATSGDYENFITLNNTRYSHIIDPRTGYPAQTKVVGVTVVADKCVIADGVATALLVLGVQDGIDFLRKHQDISAIIVYEDSEGLSMVISNELKDSFTAKTSEITVKRYF